MSGRLFCGILTGALLVLPSASEAQTPYAPSPIQQTGSWGPPKDGIHQTFRDVGRTMHHLAEPLVSPIASGGHYGPGFHASGPGHQLLHGEACPPYGPCPDPVIATSYELLPDDRFHEEHLHLAGMGDALQEAWIRFDFLHFNYENPGNFLIGASVVGLNERAGTITGTGIPVIDPRGVSYFVPDTSPINLSSNNGIKGSLGIPTRVGTLEASVWGFDQATDAIRLFPAELLVSGLPTGIIRVPGISLEVDGQPGQVVPTNVTSTILFDQGFSATTRAELFGTEAMFVFNPVTPNHHLQIQPILGVEWFNFRERFVISGRDNFTGLDHEINSRARNNIFGPTLGFRAELFLHDHVTLGVTPKLLVGFNRHKDTVYTEEIFSATEGRITTQDTDSDFAPALDLSAYVRVRMTDHLSLFVGYQLYLLSQVSRPYDNIRYNDPGTGIPGIVLDAHRQNMVVEGLTIGGEVRFY